MEFKEFLKRLNRAVAKDSSSLTGEEVFKLFLAVKTVESLGKELPYYLAFSPELFDWNEHKLEELYFEFTEGGKRLQALYLMMEIIETVICLKDSIDLLKTENK